MTTQKQASTPLMYVGLVSWDGAHDALYLRNHVTLKIKDVLARIPGVGDVGIYGAGGNYAMRVFRLDPHKVAASPAHGRRGDRRHSRAEHPGLGRPAGRRAQCAEVRDAAVHQCARLEDGRGVRQHCAQERRRRSGRRLADVARIELGASDFATLRSWSDTKNMAAVGIFLSPGANALGVAEQVYAAMGPALEGPA